MATITARVDDNLKNDFIDFCDNVGINASSMINMFLKACVKEQRVPFEISALNLDAKTFKNVFSEMHKIIKNDIPWESEEAMMKELSEDRRRRYETSLNA